MICTQVVVKGTSNTSEVAQRLERFGQPELALLLFE
jgi:hypothetical protein